MKHEKNMLLGIAILIIAVLIYQLTQATPITEFFALFGIGLVAYGYLSKKPGGKSD